MTYKDIRSMYLGYIMTYKDIRSVNNHRKKKIQKKKKKRPRKTVHQKKQIYFGGRRPYLRNNKVYFGEGIKKSQRGDGIFGTILLTALLLVGEIVKVFK